MIQFPPRLHLFTRGRSYPEALGESRQLRVWGAWEALGPWMRSLLLSQRASVYTDLPRSLTPTMARAGAGAPHGPGWSRAVGRPRQSSVQPQGRWVSYVMKVTAKKAIPQPLVSTWVVEEGSNVAGKAEGGRCQDPRGTLQTRELQPCAHGSVREHPAAETAPHCGVSAAPGPGHSCPGSINTAWFRHGLSRRPDSGTVGLSGVCSAIYLFILYVLFY